MARGYSTSTTRATESVSQASDAGVPAPKGFMKDGLGFYKDFLDADPLTGGRSRWDIAASRDVAAKGIYGKGEVVVKAIQQRAAERLHSRATDLLENINRATEASNTYLRNTLIGLKIPGVEAGIIKGRSWGMPTTEPNAKGFLNPKSKTIAVQEPDTFKMPAGISKEDRARIKGQLSEILSGSKFTPEGAEPKKGDYVFNQNEYAKRWARGQGEYDVEEAKAAYVAFVVRANEVAKSWKE